MGYKMRKGYKIIWEYHILKDRSTFVCYIYAHAAGEERQGPGCRTAGDAVGPRWRSAPSAPHRGHPGSVNAEDRRV